MADEHKKSPNSTNKQENANGLLSRLTGDANDSEIIVHGTKTRALTDPGSIIICISEEFHKSLNTVPELHCISEFVLTIHSANGTVLPYSSFVELEICVPCF